MRQHRWLYYSDFNMANGMINLQLGMVVYYHFWFILGCYYRVYHIRFVYLSISYRHICVILWYSSIVYTVYTQYIYIYIHGHISSYLLVYWLHEFVCVLIVFDLPSTFSVQRDRFFHDLWATLTFGGIRVPWNVPLLYVYQDIW